jgi:hypothetical protein
LSRHDVLTIDKEIRDALTNLGQST